MQISLSLRSHSRGSIDLAVEFPSTLSGETPEQIRAAILAVANRVLAAYGVERLSSLSDVQLVGAEPLKFTLQQLVDVWDSSSNTYSDRHIVLRLEAFASALGIEVTDE